MRKTTNQSGFSVVEALLIILVISVLCSTGYLVYKNQHKNTFRPAATTSTQISTHNSGPSTQSTDPYDGWNTFTNQQAALTFKYPSNWISQVTPNSTYTTDPSTFAGISGTLTSPNGNKLYWVYQEVGGKGDAACTPNPGDAPFSPANNCASKQTYSVQQIPSAKPTPSSVGRNLFGDRLYITETKYAWPGAYGKMGDPVSARQSAQPIYQICLDSYHVPEVMNGQNVWPQPQVGTVMGFELPCHWWDTGFNVTFPVADRAAFQSGEAKTAILIMKSFNSL